MAASIDLFQLSTGEGKPPFHTAPSFGLILFMSPDQPTIIVQHVHLHLEKLFLRKANLVFQIVR